MCVTNKRIFILGIYWNEMKEEKNAYDIVSKTEHNDCTMYV